MRKNENGKFFIRNFSNFNSMCKLFGPHTCHVRQNPLSAFLSVFKETAFINTYFIFQSKVNITSTTTESSSYRWTWIRRSIFHVDFYLYFFTNKIVMCLYPFLKNLTKQIHLNNGEKQIKLLTYILHLWMKFFIWVHKKHTHALDWDFYNLFEKSL